MMGIFNMCQPIPEDWYNETKYPNKECQIYHNNKYEFIKELWTYDAPWNNITGKWCITFAKCPKCGSYHVDITEYNDLCPEQFAGSAGLNYECKDCGYNYQEAQIMS